MWVFTLFRNFLTSFCTDIVLWGIHCLLHRPQQLVLNTESMFLHTEDGEDGAWRAAAQLSDDDDASFSGFRLQMRTQNANIWKLTHQQKLNVCFTSMWPAAEDGYCVSHKPAPADLDVKSRRRAQTERWLQHGTFWERTNHTTHGCTTGGSPRPHLHIKVMVHVFEHV